MTKISISVVLCTYNGAQFLEEQLDSLLAQTRVPDEIVIGDDGSTDGSLALLEAFAQRADACGVEVRLIRHPQTLGYVRNFSEMLRNATGDIVFLSDQDDRWRADKLERMVERFAADPGLLLLCSDARLVDASGCTLGVSLFEALELDEVEKCAVHEGRAFDVLLRRSMVTGATAALRRRVLDMCLPIGAGWIHDEWLAMVIASLGRLDVVELPLIDYRQHAANQVGMRKRTARDKWRDLVRARSEQFRAEVARLQMLENHLAGLGDLVCSGALARLARRRKHFEARLDIGSQARWCRLPMVWREARRGHYTSYGTGWRSILRDLLRHD